MPCASSEQAILRIAASLGDPAIGVRLRTVLGNLDRRNITLLTDRRHRRQRLTHHSFRGGLALRTAAAPHAGFEPICRPLRIPLPPLTS